MAKNSEKISTNKDISNVNITDLMGGKKAMSPEVQKLLFEQNTLPPPPPYSNNGSDGHNNDNNNHFPELRSSQVNEVLSQPPAWLVQWGISIFFFVLLLLLGISWFIEYPDLVTANMNVVAINLPKSATAKTDGKLIKLMVKDGDKIKKDQILAYLESTANHEEVLELNSLIDKLLIFSSRNDLISINQSKIPLFFQLGELQKSYQIFQEAFIRTGASLSDGTYLKKREILNKDLSSLQNLQLNIQSQLAIQEKDLQLTQEEAQSQERLKEKGFVSKIDARSADSKYLIKKQSFEQAKSNLDINRMTQNQKQQEILELDKTITEQKNNLIQSINTLKSEIEAWKQKYLVVSPSDGKASFLTNLQENQSVKFAQELLYILAEGSGFYGEMWVGQYNFGKVKIGQEVIVKFQSYPYQEYGTVKGIVHEISNIPKENNYLVKVYFPDGLQTSSKKTFAFKNGMSASGEIITENMRLIEKLFYNIRKSIK